MDVQEGTIRVDGYQVWYRCVGRGGLSLLLLHGGPGAGHAYLEPLAALAADRQLVFYDQLGCGRSDQPDDRSLWRLERFVAEVDTVRRALPGAGGSPSSICSRIPAGCSVWCWPAPRPAFPNLWPKPSA
jgi:proline-specific peptidase